MNLKKSWTWAREQDFVLHGVCLRRYPDFPKWCTVTWYEYKANNFEENKQMNEQNKTFFPKWLCTREFHQTKIRTFKLFKSILRHSPRPSRLIWLGSSLFSILFPVSIKLVIQTFQSWPCSSSFNTFILAVTSPPGQFTQWDSQS